MNRDDLEGELEKEHRMSHAWALTCCRGDREEAEDVLQDAYLKILDGRAQFLERSTFKTFLFGVIRRTASEHRRRAWLRGLRQASWAREETPTPAPPAGLEESLSRLPAMLANLATRQREVLELVFGHDMTIEEAARTLAISVGSARVHYTRGKQRLRRTLEEERP